MTFQGWPPFSFKQGWRTLSKEKASSQHCSVLELNSSVVPHQEIRLQGIKK